MTKGRGKAKPGKRGKGAPTPAKNVERRLKDHSTTPQVPLQDSDLSKKSEKTNTSGPHVSRETKSVGDTFQKAAQASQDPPPALSPERAAMREALKPRPLPIPIRRKPGQPTKYDPEFCELLLAHCDNGLSYESFSAVVGVHRDTLYAWERAHKEFSDTKKSARDLQRRRLELIGMAQMTGAMKGSSINWIFAMKNMCGWMDNPPVPEEEFDGMDVLWPEGFSPTPREEPEEEDPAE